MTATSRIALGTVKLGIPDYGFSSANDPSHFAPQTFLQEATKLGISKFDTSPRYGNAETVLGQYFKHIPSPPFISTKIDELSPNDPQCYQKMRESVQQSLHALHVPTIDVCYLHQNELAIISDPYVREGLHKLKDDGLIKNTGASLYSEAECEYAISSEHFDYIQIPVNVCDTGFHQRFVAQSPTSIKFVARSVFLQGTLLNQEQITQRIQHSSEMLAYFQEIEQLAKGHHFSLQDIALAFVLHLKRIDHAIIGTTRLSHLKAHLQSSQNTIPNDLLEHLYTKAARARAWTNPRNW